MDRATPSCSEDMSPMPARHPQGPNKVVPPQRVSYVFQTFVVRFSSVFLTFLRVLVLRFVTVSHTFFERFLGVGNQGTDVSHKSIIGPWPLSRARANLR